MSPPPNSRRKPCILIADEDAVVRDGVARYLRGYGHEVWVVSTGREAMRTIQRECVDLLIADINMRDVDGLEMLRTLRQRPDSVPVIAVSGGGGRFDKHLLLQSACLLGAAVALAKPFDLERLRCAVNDVLSPHPDPAYGETDDTSPDG